MKVETKRKNLNWGEENDFEIEPNKTFFSLDGTIDFLRRVLTEDQVFSDEEMATHISEAYGPEDVFTEGQLDDWAERNGYVKEGEES